jgi:hypothetical protein
LAGGQNGGVNSPEGAEKITEALVEPRTYILDGQTVEIPRETSPSAAAAAPAESPSPASDTKPKRTRRTRAQIEADEAEEAERQKTVAAAAAEASGFVVSDTPPPNVEEAVRAAFKAITLEQAVALVRERIPSGTDLIVKGF